MSSFDWHLRSKITSKHSSILTTPVVLAQGSNDLPLLIDKIMNARGIYSSDEREKYFTPSLKNLKDPFQIDGMTEAVECLIKAFKKKEKICLYADFDLDGTSGLALLLQGLRSLGYRQLIPYQPKRLTEGYGLHVSVMEKMHLEEVNLILTVDVGITGHLAVDRARQLGMDVIVTDHHLPSDSLPDANVVINPNKGNCSSGLSFLCGAGVAFYLLLALRRKMKEEKIREANNFDPKELLDCFAIATLTDLVPLVNDNRVLVKHGLRVLGRTKRVGLQVLLEKLGLKGRLLTSQELSMRFAPKLNALSRMELGLRPIDLYLVESRTEAEVLVQEVLAQNERRSQLQAEAEQMALEDAGIKKQQGYVWSFGENYHQGVVGLVATKLADKLRVPTFVGSLRKSESVIVGSVRCPKGSGFNVLQALEYCSTALTHFGGHQQASGFELPASQAEAFDQLLRTYFHSLNVQLQPSLNKPLDLVYDVECDLSDVNEKVADWISHLEPYGVGWEPIVLRLGELKVINFRELKGGHLKMTFQKDETNSYQTIDAIWFFPLETHPFISHLRQKVSFQEVKVEVLAELQWNFFAGKKNIQLLVKDLRLLNDFS